MHNYYGIPVEDVEDALAEDAGDTVHLVGRVARQDEDPRFVVADAALVLHLINRVPCYTHVHISSSTAL